MSATWPSEAELKRDHVYCGHCGERMREILHAEPRFDRKSGELGKVGHLYWECPNRGTGFDAMFGDWMDTHDENPHDSAHLRQVKGG